MDSEQQHPLTAGCPLCTQRHGAQDAVDNPSAEPAADVKDREGHRRPMNRLLVVIVSNVLGIPIGLAINDFSQPLAYRGLVGASAIAAVIVVTAWIGTFSVGTPLRRRSPWLYLSPAATMAVAAFTFSSASYAGVLIIIAVALTVGVVFLTEGAEATVILLASAATVAIGAALIRYGIVETVGPYLPDGLAIVGYGAAVIGYGTALQARWRVVGQAAAVGGGLAIIGLGVALLAGPGMLGGAAFVALGVTAIGYEITMAAGRHAGRQILGGLAAIAGGFAVIGLGLVLLAGSRLLAGAAFAALGVAAVGYGLTLVADWGMLGGALGAVGGMAAMTAGAALLAGHQLVGGTATVGGGLAVVGLGAALLDLPRIKSRVSSWCKEWITETEPSQDQGPSRLDRGLMPWPSASVTLASGAEWHSSIHGSRTRAWAAQTTRLSLSGAAVKDGRAPSSPDRAAASRSARGHR